MAQPAAGPKSQSSQSRSDHDHINHNRARNESRGTLSSTCQRGRGALWRLAGCTARERKEHICFAEERKNRTRTMPTKLLEPLVGCQVRLVGLSSRKDLNNSTVKCIKYRADRERYIVELLDKQKVAVALCNIEVQEEEPSIYSAVNMSASRKVHFGHSVLSADLATIFIERCRIEVECKEHDRTFAGGCALCGDVSPSMIMCGGCKLLQWCSEKCQRHSVEAGHGLLAM